MPARTSSSRGPSIQNKPSLSSSCYKRLASGYHQNLLNNSTPLPRATTTGAPAEPDTRHCPLAPLGRPKATRPPARHTGRHNVHINQNDVHERSQQVALMGQIHSGSTGNLIHLCEDDRVGQVERLVGRVDQVIQEATVG